MGAINPVNLLAFSEEVRVVHGAHVFKALVNEGAGFVSGGDSFADILIGDCW